MGGIEDIIKDSLQRIYSIIYILLAKIQSDKILIESLLSELGKKKEEVYAPEAMNNEELLEKWFTLNQEIQRRNKQNAQAGDDSDD
jgi:hypothetical protein